MQPYLGIAGLPGLSLNWTEHMTKYRELFPGVFPAFGGLGHDAAAAIVQDGKILFAVEEERLNRCKHSTGLPYRSMEACAEIAGVDVEQMNVSFFLNPTEEALKLFLETHARFCEPSRIPAIEHEYRMVQKAIRAKKLLWPRLNLVDHHMAHAASAFYTSGFTRSLIFVADAIAEAGATTILLGDENGIRRIAGLPLGASLGLLYAAITTYLGFEVLEDEFKIMGLAAYGDSDEFRSFFDLAIVQEEDGAFLVPHIFQDKATRGALWAKALGPPRKPDEPVEPRHIAIAYSLQRAVERATQRLLEFHEKKHKTRHLCVAGGVGLNCSMNGVIDRSGMFDRIFVQPAANDPGTSLGAALASYHQDHPNAPRTRQNDTYLGPSYTDAAVRHALDTYSSRMTWTQPADYIGEVTKLLVEGRVIGWFQGRMEFGPRALGNRSILADPTRPDMKDRVNQMVKRREEFRPFAPSVAAEGADRFFELRSHDQYEYMTVAVKAKAEHAKSLPAVVHVDGTSRVHVVRKEVNPAYWELLTRFGSQTGIPVLLNTSFNVKGEPIVCTPEDAVRCFLGTQIDHLAIQGYIVSKPKPAT